MFARRQGAPLTLMASILFATACKTSAADCEMLFPGPVGGKSKEKSQDQFVPELHSLIEKYDARTVIYRGVKSVKYPLIPKIGRSLSPESVKSREWNEKEILRLFKEQALPYLDFMPENEGVLNQQMANKTKFVG